MTELVGKRVLITRAGMVMGRTPDMLSGVLGVQRTVDHFTGHGTSVPTNAGDAR